MAQFCPRCAAPLDTSGDTGRLCETCGWFGDASETLSAPPQSDEFNPVLAALQALDLYRDVCRGELIAEQMFDAGTATEADMLKIRTSRHKATNSIVELFTATRRLQQIRQPLVLQPDINGFVGWPPEWTEHRYNARHEPCDMLVGPCCCGAWHLAAEEWVQDVLRKHHATISENL